jgi:hypothetical protein
MLVELTRSFLRARSIMRALEVLEAEPAHVLIVAPSTHSAFALARAVCRRRPCFVTGGPVSSHPSLKLTGHARSQADITKAFAGQSLLPRSVLSFPDQHIGSGPGCVVIPFLGTRYSFSAFDALLVSRHRPPVYAVTTTSGTCDFTLREVEYGELFTIDGRLLSLPGLARRLLMYLEQELARPPRDWLARECFRLKSEGVRWLRLREELKDVECLLRLHLQSRCCDRMRTETALAAVVARQKLFARSVPT